MITAQDAIEALRKAVEARGGDFVYESPMPYSRCVYVDDNMVPSCGVGVALSLLGWTPSDLAVLDRGEDELGVGANVLHTNADHLENSDLMVDRDAALVFGRFQEFQDEGTPWGESLDHAEREYRRITTTEKED